MPLIIRKVRGAVDGGGGTLEGRERKGELNICALMSVLDSKPDHKPHLQ